MAKFKTEFLATKEIDIGEVIPDGIITIREPTRKQVYDIKRAGSDDEKIMAAVIKLAPDIVISHNVEKEDGELMPTPELLTALFESLRFTKKIIEGVTGFFSSTKESSEG